MKYQDHDKNPGYQLWLATNAWQRIVRKALEPTHLTYVQFVLLASIHNLGEGDSVTQAQVSRFAATDENMTSQVVRSLAERGFLTRRDHPTDARARCIELTSEGHKVLAEAREAIRPVRDEFFAPLGDQASVLAQLLAKVVEADEQSAEDRRSASNACAYD
jgi:DNA-binding MarR family transcriptional regulator